MKKWIISLVVIAIAYGATSIVLIKNNEKNNQICFKNNCFEVELAVTPQEQARGLMFRQELEPNKGMLFVFSQEGDYPFWMKNTLISLDIIWIDKDKKVVFISQNTMPCQSDSCVSVNPNKQALYVLEVNSGTAKKIGLATGDKLDIKVSLPQPLIY